MKNKSVIFFICLFFFYAYYLHLRKMRKSVLFVKKKENIFMVDKDYLVLVEGTRKYLYVIFMRIQLPLEISVKLQNEL